MYNSLRSAGRIIFSIASSTLRAGEIFGSTTVEFFLVIFDYFIPKY